MADATQDHCVLFSRKCRSRLKKSKQQTQATQQATRKDRRSCIHNIIMRLPIILLYCSIILFLLISEFDVVIRLCISCTMFQRASVAV